MKWWIHGRGARLFVNGPPSILSFYAYHVNSKLPLMAAPKTGLPLKYMILALKPLKMPKVNSALKF